MKVNELIRAARGTAKWVANCCSLVCHERPNVPQQCTKKLNLKDIFEGGFPTLPACIFQLEPLLNTSPVDLKAVSRIIGLDQDLAGQLINICNSAMAGLPENVSTLEEAVLLLGTERLKALILTCHLMEYTRHGLAPRLANAFWRHCFLTALLSRQLAYCLRYPQPEEAYLAGLLHDIGFLPLIIFAARNQLKTATLMLDGTRESLQAERDTFGVDHCQVGRMLGASWNFPRVLLDVLEHHHQPEKAIGPLVGIVAAVCQFCEMHGVAVGATDSRLRTGLRDKTAEVLRVCLPALGQVQRAQIADALEAEFRSLMQQHFVDPWSPLDC